MIFADFSVCAQACASLEEGYLPPVTFIVVQKRHHTRLFPEDHRAQGQTDRSGNILPGKINLLWHMTSSLL
jgi:eukaryotic translation initiation factor 2C